MNKRNHEDIARDAWVIYKQAQTMQETILKVFVDDFMDFEVEERKLRIEQEELPF